MIEPYYQDSAVTIYNADCRQVLPFLPQFDLLLTDPPYGIGADKKKAHRSIRDNPNWSESNWDQTRPAGWVFGFICEYSKTKIIWGGNYFSDNLPPSQCWLVWDKGQREFSLADCELAWTSLDKAVRAFDCPRTKALQDGKVHPTQKPISLMRWCLSLAPDAQTILDPFAGSGTTGVAAKLEGRKATLIEISEEYCEKAANRLRQEVLF